MAVKEFKVGEAVRESKSGSEGVVESISLGGTYAEVVWYKNRHKIVPSKDIVYKGEMELVHEFKVGDFVAGVEGSPYSYTGRNMTKGIVTGINEATGNIRVRAIENTSKILTGETRSFACNPKYFVKYEEPKKVVVTPNLTEIKMSESDMQKEVTIEQQGMKMKMTYKQMLHMMETQKPKED